MIRKDFNWMNKINNLHQIKQESNHSKIMANNNYKMLVNMNSQYKNLRYYSTIGKIIM